jgi:hypothetical protein
VVARTVAEVLADHVVFEVECIDRLYSNVYIRDAHCCLAVV